MHVNIHGLRSHLAELSAVIRLASAPPDIVCINETFLDDGVKEVELEGYNVVGRRDRSCSGDNRNCGGVVVFAKTELADHVTLSLKSEDSERMWFQFCTPPLGLSSCRHGTDLLSQGRCKLYCHLAWSLIGCETRHWERFSLGI